MIRFLFHRDGAMVRAMEVAGAVLLACAAVRALSVGAGPGTWLLLAANAALYAFLRICALRRWYPGAPRGAGIELQFSKAMVPTGYILTIAMAWFLLAPGAAPLLIAAILLAIVAHVNVILLTFHRRDCDPLPVNAFSGAPKAVARTADHDAAGPP